MTAVIPGSQRRGRAGSLFQLLPTQQQAEHAQTESPEAQAGGLGHGPGQELEGQVELTVLGPDGRPPP